MAKPDKNIVKKSYPVLNMSCAACASSSQNVLKRQDGVVSASVNYGNGMAVIEYDSSKTDPQKLKSALQDIGYDLLLDEGNSAQDKLEAIHKKRMKTLLTKVIVAIVFSLPVVVIAMTPSLMHMKYANLVMWILSTPVVFYCGSQFFAGAYKQAKHLSSNMDTLVALSSGVAYLFSVFNTLYPQFWTNRGLEAHVYFEAVAVVIMFVLIGKLLEERAKGSTSSAIKKLMGLQPKTVTVISSDGQQKEVSINEIAINDTVLVKPGEKIAVDGTVLQGSSFVDESMISGEPVPVEKKESEKVFAGTINQKGSFRFRADKVGKDTLLSQIIQMVQDAQGSKAPVQKLVDKIAGIFVPIVIGVAVASFIIWTVFGGQNGITYGLLALITVLVIACPCALGLATPTAIMVGIGKGAENGILIKDAESLELAKKVNVVVLDKTGTITEGKPAVTDILWLTENIEPYRNILFSIERSSEHPLAEAVSNYLNKDAAFINGIEIESVSGRGVRGKLNDEQYFAGNMQMAKEAGVNIDNDTEKWINEKLDLANTVILFGDSKEAFAVVAIADKIKKTSAQAVKQLQNEGIDVYMLTGDNEQTAKAVAIETGINHYKANLLPADKVGFIKQMQSQGKTVAMVGDGINDSVALAQADVSIAMGKGSDIAMDVAKMTIISDDLTKIPQAINLSRKTVRTIKQNLFWAFIYNVIGIPVAAGILYPFNGFLLNPMIAGAAMALSSVSVVTNSLRLKFINLNK
ncbi:MAG: heavy metal translocating P-type ATPase [Dysgonomonas sp.]